MRYKESIEQIEDTAFGIEIRKQWKDRLREINTILFEAKQADSEEQTLMYLDQLPSNYQEMTAWLFDRVMKNHDVEKLSFIQGAFVASEAEVLTSKMNDLLRSQKKSHIHEITNGMPDGLKAILEDIIRRRNDD